MKGSTCASEMIEVARAALIVFDRSAEDSTTLGTDNSANLAIAMGTATPARAIRQTLLRGRPSRIAFVASSCS